MNRITSLTFLLLALGGAAAMQQQTPQKAPPPPPNVRALLHVGIDNGLMFVPDLSELIQMGERAFPELERLLRDPTVTPLEVSRIVNVISSVQADRRRFV